MKTSKSKAKELSKKGKEKQKNILEMLLKVMEQKYMKILTMVQFPKFSIPSRSVSNIVYDKKLRQYILGNSNLH